MDQLAVSGKAHYQGIPATTVAFGTPGNQASASATGHTLTIYTKVDKSHEADVAVSRDNDNEIISRKRTNKTVRLSFSAKPVGTAKADAITLSEACPLKDDVVVITCADDDQVAGTAYVDSASVSYTPDGDAVMDFVVIKYPNTFVVAS